MASTKNLEPVSNRLSASGAGWLLAGVLVAALAACRQQTDSPARTDTHSLPAAAAAAELPPSPTQSKAAALNDPLPSYELRIEPKALLALQRQSDSDQTSPALFVADGKEYQVKVRTRGAWARTWPKKPLKIFFEDGHEFEGNHCLNLNSAWHDPAFVREPLAYQVLAACGVPASRARMVHLQVNGRFYGLYVEVEQPSKPLLKRYDLKGASIYKANSSAGCADERDLGSEQSYAAHYEKENRKSEGYRDLQLFCHELATATNPLQFFTNHVDLEKYINYLAGNALVQNWDCLNKNHFLVHEARGERKWFVLPWDLDRTFGDHWHGSFHQADVPLLLGARPLPGPTGWNRMANYFLNDTILRTRFLDRLDQLLREEFTKEKLFPILDHLESQIEPDAARDRNRWPGASADLHAGIAEVKSFIERRRVFLAREIARMRREG